jgi:1-acyl-sn-glycerol-3-phosphate acyltransferase
MTRLKVWFRLFLFSLNCVWITLLQWPMLRFYRGRYSFIAPRWWQAAATKIFGITIRVHGTPYEAKQTLYIANHISYIDIPVMGSLVRGAFVARADLAGWPLFGFLATLQQTAFISRDKNNARQEKENLERLIAEGKNMILFAEGTSTDGTNVLPFKSSLFALVYDENGKALDLMVQPVTISVASVDGRPVERGPGPIRDSFTWHGDMTLGPHIMARAAGTGAVVDVTFHPPYNPADFNGDRKALAAACYNDVAGAMPALSHAA